MYKQSKDIKKIAENKNLFLQKYVVYIIIIQSKILCIQYHI